MPSLRLTESCEMYKRSLEELFDDENRFVDFLRYSGRFYKLPFTHAATLYRYNPDAEMWADYETWKRYGNNVLRNQRSSAVHIGGNQLKHYFEIGQTTHTTTPYQWSINKAVLQDFLSEVNLSENKTYRSLASYINRHVEQWTSDHAEDILKSFNISSDGKAQFLKSFCTLAETVVSARCEHNSTYKYRVPDVPDLTALKTLQSPEDLERICGFVQTAAKTVLLGIERKVTKIINLQRSEQNEQHNREVSQERREAGNDMVRGGTEALSEVRLRREAGDNVSTGHTNVDIQSDNRSDNGHSDEETAGRTDREVRQEVAEVYGGKQSRNDTAPSGQLTLGDYSEGDRQGSRGVVSDTGRSVSHAEPTPDGIYGNGEVGKNEADGNRPRDNDTDSPSVPGIIEQSNIETQTAEISEEIPAVSAIPENQHKSTVVINAFGGAGAGKTTACLHIAAELKKRGYVAEYVPEYAKELVWDKNFELLDGSEKNQRIILNEQRKRLDRLIGQVDFVVTDAPLLLNGVYLKETDNKEEYCKKLLEDFNAYNNFNFVVKRDPANFEQEGRIHTLEESISVDVEVENLLKSNQLFFGKYDHSHLDDVVDNSIKTFQRKLSISEAAFATSEENKTKEETEVRFNSVDFEKLIPSHMRFKEVNLVNGNEIYWVTQDIFSPNDLKEFQQAIRNYDGNIKKFYVTPRDLSPHYTFEEDLANKVLATVTPDEILQDDYIKAIEKSGLGIAFEAAESEENDLNTTPIGDDVVEIYQLKDDENLRDYRFVSLEQLHKDGHNVESENYKPVYSFNLKNGETLEDIYDKFNISRPDDFNGHSLSMGDIIVIKQNGKTTAHYVDRIGFAEVPEFFLSREQKTAEMSTVTAYRVGDFYEFFGQDAKTVAERLNLALTRRGDTPMTGIPTHVFDFDDYMDKLSEMQINVKVGNIKEVEHLFKPKDDKSATAEENQTKEETEVRFNSVDFEKLIPSNMRFKQVDLVNGNEIYWVTQDIFSPNDLKAFQQAVRNYDGNIKKFYVTPRDLSPHYTFEEDLTNSVLATVTPDEILQDDYIKAIEKSGLGIAFEGAESEENDLNTTPIGDDDYFFNRPEAEEYEAIYYNPYADAGGQFVIMHLPYDLIAEANKNTDTVDAFYEYLDEHAKTELVDLGTPEYEAMLDEYAAPHPDFIGRNSDVMDKLVQSSRATYITEPELSDREKRFMELDIAPIMAKSSLAWDEIEDLGYVFFEDNYTEKNSPSDKAVYGNGMHEPEVFKIAAMFRNGDDISKELAIGLFGTNSKWYYNFNESYDVEITDQGFLLTCDNVQREVSFKELSDSFLKYFKDEYMDIEKQRAKEKLDTVTQSNQQHNFHITDDTSLNSWGGEKTRYNKNIEAIKLLHDLENSGRTATAEEQQVLAQYAGWGGVSKAFDPNNTSWEKEYNELKELLTPEEYAAAKSSINNAHFTNPEIIRAMYKALENMGIKDGNILEPSMGVGNFFGCLPKAMQDCKLYGVELDSITGRIAKQLYPKADIQIKGFEKAEFPDNYFSAAIGNVPFGNYGVADKNYDKHNFLIHDYFFAKALDKVAANGIVAFITSKGTLDKQNSKVREYLAQHADLVGAIRLPNNAFKGSANTEVTSDIIFLRKREKAPVEMPDWVYVGENADGIPINQYFVDNPDMILGKMERTSGRFGEDIVCTPIEDADLASQLDRAVAKLKIDTALKIKAVSQDKENGIIPATDDVRNFTYTIIDNKIYFRENGQMTEVPANAKKFDRIKGLIELRETLRHLIDIQTQGCTDIELTSVQAQLEKQYNSFVEKYGYINDRQNSAVFSDDDDYNTLCSIELIDPESKKVEKAAIFSQRTVKPLITIKHVDTPQEAMQVSLDVKGKIDMPYMAELCSRSVEQLTDELIKDGLIYRSPDTMEYEDYSEYLSGNVRQKLRTAELYAQTYPEFERNVNALKNVIPPTINAGEIHAALGVSWVDTADYEKFMMEYAHANKYNISPLVRTYSGEYKVPHKNTDTSISATSTYGTKRMSSYAIFENLLNNRDLIVRDALLDPDGGKTRYVINQKETQYAKEKGRQMQEAFAKWLWQDPDRRQKYVDRYNELFNSIVGREFDGSHQTFPGMSPYIELKAHQKDAIARAKYGGNTLFAHAVGAGKSFEMIASVMEKQRLGLINKACVAVPKALVGQMAAEWLRLYPQAKLLVATEKDFTKDNRQKFIARCCTGDYAAVIMSYEQFEKIPMSLEYQKQFIEREINVLTNNIQSLKSSGTYGYDAASKTSIKDMEMQRKKLQARLIKLIEGGKTKDTSLSFEQLGFDCMVIDEAHNYKNGLIVTKMQGVSGVQSSPAQKSEDMLMKTTYLNETSGCKNIIFATGTPVSNSMSELYTMQRYLRPDLLAASGIQNFDDWASNFGEVVSQLELKPAGDGYRPKKRFAKFVNLPELMQMYKEFADIKTSDSLNLPVPDIKGGKPQTIVASPNDFQKEYLQILAQRSERIHSGAVDPSEDNMLKITHEARLLGLDARTLNPEAENSPNSKVNLCIDKIMEIYQKTSADKGVQAVFCDIAINNTDGRFSVYDYIKEELIKRGIPKDEICFAGDAKDQKQRNEMQAQLRAGSKRIVLASTSKLGTGANIQTRLAALHHLDIPWKPSDLEQRNGRIVRQGNMFKEVEIYNYVTENTFDAYMLNIVVNKQKFISQLMSNSKTTARTCEDVDELVLNYAEMQALATGDPRIKEKIELDGEVAKLRTLESEHLNEIYRLQDFVVGGNHRLITLENQLEMCKQDAAFAQEHTLPEGQFSIHLLGKEYAERKDAATVLQKQILDCMTSDGEKNIGTYRGFNVSISREAVGYSTAGFCYSYVPYIHLQNGGTKYSAELQEESSDVGIGNITRLENVVKFSIDRKIKDLEKNISDLKTDIQEAERTKDLPFELAEELQQKSERLSQLNAELNLGKIDESIMENEPSADKSFEKDNLKSDKKHGDVRR